MHNFCEKPSNSQGPRRRRNGQGAPRDRLLRPSGSIGSMFRPPGQPMATASHGRIVAATSEAIIVGIPTMIASTSRMQIRGCGLIRTSWQLTTQGPPLASTVKREGGVRIAAPYRAEKHRGQLEHTCWAPFPTTHTRAARPLANHQQ